MAWMQVIGNCIGCGIIFGFNAEHVPSIPIDGVREPLCRDCVNRLNSELVSRGRQPIWVHPDAWEPQEVE